MTHELWSFTLRSLYERHKLLFTLMLAMKIDVQKGLITHEEFMTFVKGGASLDLNAVQPKPFKWILDITWLNLVEISKLQVFNDVLTRVSIRSGLLFYWTHVRCRNRIDVAIGFCFRSKTAKKNGGIGTKKKSQRKKICRAVIRNL